MLKLFQGFIGRWSFHRDISHYSQTNHIVNPFLSAPPTSCSTSSLFQNQGSTLSNKENNNNNINDNNLLLEEKMTVDGFASFIPLFEKENSLINNNTNNTNNNSNNNGNNSINKDNNITSLQYEEKGTLFKDDGTSCPITQRYIYSYENEKINVYFDTKEPSSRLLHSLDFVNSSLATGYHWCSPDHYNATYEFISTNEFKLTYSVLGPKKNYKMITTFKKQLDI